MFKKVLTNKVNTAKILIDLHKQLAICSAYLEQQPDPAAKKRVAELDKNPCKVSGWYYLNAIYKDNYTEDLPKTLKEQEIIPYEDADLHGYIVEYTNWHSKNKLKEDEQQDNKTIRYSLSELNAYIKNNKDDLNIKYFVYVDYSQFISGIVKKKCDKLNKELLHSLSDNFNGELFGHYDDYFPASSYLNNEIIYPNNEDEIFYFDDSDTTVYFDEVSTEYLPSSEITAYYGYTDEDIKYSDEYQDLKYNPKTYALSRHIRSIYY